MQCYYLSTGSNAETFQLQFPVAPVLSYSHFGPNLYISLAMYSFLIKGRLACSEKLGRDGGRDGPRCHFTKWKSAQHNWKELASALSHQDILRLVHTNQSASACTSTASESYYIPNLKLGVAPRKICHSIREALPGLMCFVILKKKKPVTWMSFYDPSDSECLLGTTAWHSCLHAQNIKEPSRKMTSCISNNKEFLVKRINTAHRRGETPNTGCTVFKALFVLSWHIEQSLEQKVFGSLTLSPNDAHWVSCRRGLGFCSFRIRLTAS